MSSFNNSTPNFDNLLLQSLVGHLQIGTPPPPAPSNHRQDHLPLSHSFQDFLLDATANYRFSDSEDADSDEFHHAGAGMSQLAKEEAKLEIELIKIILAGNTETLKPNSGQAVSIGEDHICVGFHEEVGSEYRVWEWHGHIMMFDDENGYTQEYVYGNYFERLLGSVSWVSKEASEEGEEETVPITENLGLMGLIGSEESTGSRILHRSLNAGSPRVGTLQQPTS